MPSTVPWSPRAFLPTLDWFMLKQLHTLELHCNASCEVHPMGPCDKSKWEICLSLAFLKLGTPGDLQGRSAGCRVCRTSGMAEVSVLSSEKWEHNPQSSPSSRETSSPIQKPSLVPGEDIDGGPGPSNTIKAEATPAHLCIPTPAVWIRCMSRTSCAIS